MKEESLTSLEFRLFDSILVLCWTRMTTNSVYQQMGVLNMPVSYQGKRIITEQNEKLKDQGDSMIGLPINYVAHTALMNSILDSTKRIEDALEDEGPTIFVTGPDEIEVNDQTEFSSSLALPSGYPSLPACRFRSVLTASEAVTESDITALEYFDKHDTQTWINTDHEIVEDEDNGTLIIFFGPEVGRTDITGGFNDLFEFRITLDSGFPLGQVELHTQLVNVDDMQEVYTEHAYNFSVIEAQE